MKQSERLFAPFEIALQDFYIAGGVHVTAVRSPTAILQEFTRICPSDGIGTRYINLPVELAQTQDHVSIQGTTAKGVNLEYPYPI